MGVSGEKRQLDSSPRIRCPHCESAMRIRGSRLLTPTYRQLNMQCTNVACSASYRADLTLTHIISPSGIPNPQVQLPISPNQPQRAAANDTGEPRRESG